MSKHLTFLETFWTSNKLRLPSTNNLGYQALIIDEYSLRFLIRVV
jgi:hypothetical protein